MTLKETLTLYGLRTESDSRDMYKSQCRCDVFELGSVIRPEIPWLLFSPDVVRNNNGEPVAIFENKSPEEGKRLSAAKLIIMLLKIWTFMVN